MRSFNFPPILCFQIHMYDSYPFSNIGKQYYNNNFIEA